MRLTNDFRSRSTALTTCPSDTAGHRWSTYLGIVVDTGFEGDLAVSKRFIRQLDATFEEERSVLMASGREEVCSVYSLVLEWQNEERVAEVLALPGNSLLGIDTAGRKLSAY
jgi:predicted aspartyl protease